MSAFTALNVEPDENLDEDIDNTREIQIEEALKLYQSALKLHSQGPAYYEQADAAYNILFKSEVFKYPESVTEFTRSYEHPELEFEPEFAFSLEADLVATGTDGSPSSLPQILYLAYKNHGQFIMDQLRHRIRAGLSISPNEVRAQATIALEQFAQALARDESDTELWRRAARIGSFVGSERIVRYCLEAAVEADDDPTLGEVEPSDLEEGFAGVQLKEHLEALSDEVALSHPIMGPYAKKTMSQRLKNYINPYPFLPQISDRMTLSICDDHIDVSHVIVNISERSWASVGEALWRAVTTCEGSSTPISLLLPDGDSDMTDTAGIPPVRPGLPSSSANSTSEGTPVSNDAIVVVTKAERRQSPEEMNGRVVTSTQQNHEVNGEQDESQISRKRSQSVAGIQEPGEEDNGAQKRSKRIRNRDTLTTEVASTDPSTQYKDQLHEYSQGDQYMFSFIGSLLDKLGVSDLGTVEELQEAVNCGDPQGLEDNNRNAAVADLRDISTSWDEMKASLFASGNGTDLLGSSSAKAGLAAFLEHSKAGAKKSGAQIDYPDEEGLNSFVKHMNTTSMPLQDVAYEYFKCIRSSYRYSTWSDGFKHTFIRLLNHFDSETYSHLQEDIEALKLKSVTRDDVVDLEEFSQMLFELRLDVYSSITNPSSVVPYIVRVAEKERLDRWAVLASDLIQGRECGPDDELCLRYLWAAASFASMAEGATREYVIACWTDIQHLLQEVGDPRIELQNNAAMSEISASAADREISKLTTMDFFLNLFKSDKSDPLIIIETLEPVLDPGSVEVESLQPQTEGTQETVKGPSQALDENPSAISPVLRDMWRFLEGGSSSLRLFLWQRLREAYQNINYTTKVFSCHLKSIEIIVSDLCSQSYFETSKESRQQSLLSWLKTLDDLLVKALTLALNDQTAFEIIDDAHVKSSSKALALLSRLLHSAALLDDNVRVGMVQLPRTPSYTAQGSFTSFVVRMREMQVRSWALLYTVVKEGMSQNKELFPAMDNDLADYLAAVHYSLGLRKCCKISNKIFLKMMKVEMVRLKHVERWEDYLGQVLFDLYGIRLGAGVYELQEHGCPNEALDRRTAFSIADQVIVLANRMSMKDLLKAELRPTIEKMQQAIGPAKSNPQMLHNLRNYTEYLKTSVHPLRMYQALKGQVYVDSLPVITTESPLADKGWYFLLGNIALSKFRSQKRIAPGATDDLKVAASFFRLQLQFTSELWETWYRLAQCFDAELEEDVLWSADKLNSERPPLIQLQRSAIHCYIMAVSTAMRSADATFETSSKIADLYHDYGMRLYSSSREPFGMEAFYLDDFERHFSGSGGMYKKSAHEELSRYKVWRYAANLFKKALIEKPNYWMNHFMLGKCLWKMYSRVGDEYDALARATRPTMWQVLNAFLMAIETVPRPKDSRSEPIFEPHYKIMSIVHKLVRLGELDLQEAANILQRQPYALRKGEAVVVNDADEWEKFILESIRHLRNADKSNWHHRMIIRATRLLYDEAHPDYEDAVAARNELKDSMFTKTMVVNVWKPEFERAGRHCVYMERYVRLMIKLLFLLNDKPNMELLAKRVRKRQAEYYHFTEVWTECCTAYYKLLRRSGDIPQNQDEIIKSFPPEEFGVIAEVLQQWCDDPATTHPILEILKEAQELKKVNQNLMKPMPLDDLISDTYAALVIQVGVKLPRPLVPPPPPGPPQAAVNEVRSQGPMSLNNLVSNMDGTVSIMMQPLPDEASRPRHKSLTRREILRRAEAAVTRVPEAPRLLASATPRPRASDQSPALAANGRVSSGGAQTALEPHKAELRGEGGEREGDSSAPGSVHDSADDESDLSDAPDGEDGEEAAMLFPNLGRAEGRGGRSESGSTPAATIGNGEGKVLEDSNE